jgi:polysaccharide biosynthesis/export protein
MLGGPQSLGGASSADALGRLLSTQVPDSDPALLLGDARNGRRPEVESERLTSDGESIDKRIREGGTIRDKVVQATPLERDYSRRAGVPVLQIGYNLLGGAGDRQASVGAIWDDYSVGIGDEIVLTLRGARNSTVSVVVDREGRITLPEAPPFSVVGKPFSEVVSEIQRVVEANFVQTTAFVSLGRVRAISVTMAGEVGIPGRYVLNSLNTLTDALAEAGGVRKTGTLRKIRISRGAQSWTVDLYPLLLRASPLAENPRLEDGDRIVVDTLGPNVAIVGDVLREGIFELSPGRAETTADVLALAGGTIRGSGNTLSVQRLNEGGLDEVRDLVSFTAKPQRNDIIRVDQSTVASDGFVVLAGNVALPGRRTVTANPTIYELIEGGKGLGDNTYTLLAILETRNPTTFLREYVPVNLVDILARRVDVRLESGDAVYVFNRSDIDFLSSDSVLATTRGEIPQNKDDSCAGLAYLNGLVAKGYFFRTAFDNSVSDRKVPFVMQCPSIFDEKEELIVALLNNSIGVSGEVRAPGLLPIAGGTSLALVIESLGGVANGGDPDYIEILRSNPDANNGWQRVMLSDLALNSIALNPFDSVRVARRDDIQTDGYVTLRGELKRPGRYGITHGEKLRSVIARAGGLTPEAYPYGAVFQRVSVQAAERAAYARAAAELRSAVPLALARSGSSSNTSDPATAISAVQAMMTAIENTPAVGRVVIEADPVVLQVRPEADFFLENGDTLTIPKRPAHVSVAGEVLLPTAMQFVSGAQAMDYIRSAGGASPQADLGRAFILLPNGVAERVQTGFLGSRNASVPPGSTIIVPRDAVPLDILTLTKDTLGIVSSVAVTAASLAVIFRDN